MTTLEQFAEKMQGFSREYVIELFYDSLKRSKEWKDRFKQAEQERTQLITEKEQPKKDHPEKAQEWLSEQMLAKMNQEIRKVREEAGKEKAQALYEKDELIFKMKTDIEKLQKLYIPPQGIGMPQEDKVVIALGNKRK